MDVKEPDSEEFGWEVQKIDGFKVEISTVGMVARCYYCKKRVYLGKLCKDETCWAQMVLETRG